MNNKQGHLIAILSAFLFGVAPLLAKLVAGDLPSLLLAGLLYLGSGIGLTLYLLVRRIPISPELVKLPRRQLAFLSGAVLCGGILAPVALAYGIRYATAAEVSLLLNFEAVTTTIIAALVFREHVGPRVWVGKVVIVLAAAFLVIAGSGTFRLSIPGMAVLAACLLWGVDNNLTREIDEMPAAVLAAVKGLVAGCCNVLFGVILFGSSSTIGGTAGALLIGAFSFGVSLVLFVEALRAIGSARTSTWFATGPFIGSLLSVLLLSEMLPPGYWPAMALMLVGAFFLYGEQHTHVHLHDATAHTHRHRHDDEHHRHAHQDGEAGEPHDHFHLHEPLEHAHVHWPDPHHRHSH